MDQFEDYEDNETTGPYSDYVYDEYGYDTDSSEPCDLNSFRNWEIKIQTYIYSIICVVGLLGNIMVIVTYAFYKKAKSMTDVYLINVAVADLIFVVALPLIIYNEHYDWSMGNVACKVLRGTYSINLYSSTLLLACISGDRYIAIVQARRSFGARPHRLVYSRLVCLTIWSLAVVLSIPTVIYYQRYEEQDLYHTKTVECNFNFNHTETAKLMKVLVPSTQISVGFFLPLLIMGFCYSSIMATLLRAQNFGRHKAVRVVLAVVIVFVICHLPYNVALLYHTINLFKQRPCMTEKIILVTVTVTRSVAYLHCCLNPFLYAFIGVKFRNHFQKILTDLWCKGKKYIYSSRSSRQTSDLYIPAPTKSAECHEENPSSFTM